MSVHYEKLKHIQIRKIDNETYEISTCNHLSNYMYVDVNDLKELKEEVEKVLEELKER